MNSLFRFSLPSATSAQGFIAVPVPAAVSALISPPAAARPVQQYTARQLAAGQAHRAQALASRRSSIPSSAKRF
ncbi:hypothetical protein [Hymenobacter chitinivorans]|uniref:Uncharacterized protein n=1 Tax=Hymenobacter chitinivorans DSM 11115 TaxID=1121954 RepID=A0A2M9B9S9_9BACT|nr:hypothetical protein [Hymenobacter chitinivorans]PJJ54700.1 hypothetical protein CLV45_3046 [Hymenobacter chitinivorans DSM 11115]